MKEPEYIEGSKALGNFKRGMKALFKVSKAAIVQGKQKKPKTVSSAKPKPADKD